ncbi:hypothetical protein UCD39_18920 [Nitrospirillum sp. BR 11752]|uniref:hypothetical protein n=1 Tax=Nitrospirillum sp. BR 11752 TaxID=3104293 RepID=UPI002EC47E25|nr:hypothetical protein [Nitrospirillum sp. BR 11752]
MLPLAYAPALSLLLPTWAALLIVVILATIAVCAAGLVLAKVGRNPYWALLLYFPVLGVPALWYLAYTRWPRQKG